MEPLDGPHPSRTRRASDAAATTCTHGKGWHERCDGCRSFSRGDTDTVGCAPALVAVLAALLALGVWLDWLWA